MVRQRHLEIRTKKRILVPTDPSKPTTNKSSTRWLFVSIASLLAVLYVMIPVAFYLSISAKRYAIFLNFIKPSLPQNLSYPKEMGLNCTQNFYIESDDGILLGTWHVPAAEAMPRCKGNSFRAGEEFLDSRPVFLYFHGNTNTRGGNHRLQLYKVLSKTINAHVISFDYRGYGDSTNILPCQHGVVNDSLTVYHWLRKRVDTKRIYVWGHSLGTGVATAVLGKLVHEDEVPAGLILEAPFSKPVDAVKTHPFSFLHRYMPFFDSFFIDPIASETELFNSVTNIGHVKSPVLILHAEDDLIVPFRLGEELYQSAISKPEKKSPSIEFIRFDRKLGYGHKHIHKDPGLPNIVTQFIEKAQVLVPKT